MQFENRNYAFAGTFVDELVRCGLKHVCISPGSRSSPLAISFARRSEIKKWVHLDERSAAFFALGIAKYSGQPAALVCSSGTAAANFSPAVIEAFYAGVPLIVLTADRPPELHDWGALQTIYQSNLYGKHVKWAVSLPTPEITNEQLAFVRATACRAFATASQGPPGPVHLNFSFREPLEPLPVPGDFQKDASAELFECTSNQPYLQRIPNYPASVPLERARALGNEICGKRGLIVCGPDSGNDIAASVVELADRLDYPIAADCLSHVRCGIHDLARVIDTYDTFLCDPGFIQTGPEVIIRFGTVPVSKSLASYMERFPRTRQIIIDPFTRWRNHSHTCAEVWTIDETAFCTSVAGALRRRKRRSDWSRQWFETNAKTRAGLNKAASNGMFEGKIFVELAKTVPENGILFAGNSMPVRDMDTFFPAQPKAVRFMANRGASGIDGVTSTALGVSSVSGERTVLVLGDISFYHDMNGLLAAKKFGLNATIVVINNDGGGIFSFLPQSASKDVFEEYFGTPHGLTFRHAAEMYGLNYAFSDTWAKFNAELKKSLANRGTTLIEVPGNRDRNLRQHRMMRQQVLSGINY